MAHDDCTPDVHSRAALAAAVSGEEPSRLLVSPTWTSALTPRRHRFLLSAHRQRDPSAVRPPPCRPELAVVGPHPGSPLLLGDDREIAVGPVRIMLVVAHQPIENLEPQGFVLAPIGRDREFVKEAPQPLALRPARQEEARLGEHRRTENEGLAREPVEVTERSPIERVTRVAQRDNRRGVEEDHELRWRNRRRIRRRTLARSLGSRSPRGRFGGSGYSREMSAMISLAGRRDTR